MPSPRKLDGRSIAAVVCLALVLAAEVSSVQPGELKGRAGALPVFARMPPENGTIGGSGFAFARRLGPFLLAVERGTPPTATVALSCATDAGDAATYASAYLLAPRRVVGPARIGEADFAAWFRKRPDESVPGGLSNPFPAPFPSSPVPFGELARVR